MGPVARHSARLRVCVMLAASTLAAGAATSAAREPAAEAQAPFQYVWARAYHILPETTNQESGYFSLCEGLDGRIYIGTAKYGENAFVVEFDPATGTQRVVIDVNKVCGLTAQGYAAQAKVHTRNFVGPSGTLYVGSKHGYRLDKSDTSDYPGGYVITYDPRTGRAESLGMPYPGLGVIDVVADEARGLIYAVTCEDEHWMLLDRKTGRWSEIGPMLVDYATTLVASDGRAYAITGDYDLAAYDPESGEVSVRPLRTPQGESLSLGATARIPYWRLAEDGRTAYLLRLGEPTLFKIDLLAAGDTVTALPLGKMVEGANPDCRSALDIGPDGRVYALVRVDNETGFGTGFLHHLARYDPGTGEIEDLGVLAIENPDFFDFEAARERRQGWTHGYHTLPDGALTPLHSHHSLVAAHDGTLYATILYPFTLLRIEQFRHADDEADESPAARYLDAALSWCDRLDADMGRFTELGELVARRHAAGGLIGTRWGNQSLGPELYGRAGNFVHMGFERPFKEDRSPAERANDVAIFGWDGAPDPGDADRVRRLRDRGAYVIGMGPAGLPDLAEVAALCDTFVDTGFGADDRAVRLPDGSRVGHGNHVVNALHGWVLMAETFGALTRMGKTPTMAKSYSYPDGPEWFARYLGKKQFHDEPELQVPPQPPGALGHTYVERIRYLLRRLRIRELTDLRRAAELVGEELAAGRKTVVAWAGHMPEGYVGLRDDSLWCQPVQLHPFLDAQRKAFRERTPDGALVIRLGYHGLDARALVLLREKKQRLVLLAGESEDPAWQPPRDVLVYVDLGWAFGDACVSVEGYPFPLFAPSGIMQAVAYEAIHAEVTARAGEPVPAQ